MFLCLLILRPIFKDNKKLKFQEINIYKHSSKLKNNNKWTSDNKLKNNNNVNMSMFNK